MMGKSQRSGVRSKFEMFGSDFECECPGIGFTLRTAVPVIS
jgi:hypothetical protein